MNRKLVEDLHQYFEKKDNKNASEVSFLNQLTEELPYFQITAISREDLTHRGFDVDDVDDEDMRELAQKMESDYCEQLFWQSMEIIASEGLEIPKFICPKCGKGAAHLILKVKCTIVTLAITVGSLQNRPDDMCWSNILKIASFSLTVKLGMTVTTRRTTERCMCQNTSIQPTPALSQMLTNSLFRLHGLNPRNISNCNTKRSPSLNCANLLSTARHSMISVLRPFGFHYQ